jgi:predicted DNA-binding transcriptional regulator AlpA
MTARLIAAREVAAMLGRSKAWFERHRARLEAEHGFPPAVAAVGARWDVRAVAAWVDAQTAPQAAAQAIEIAGEAALLERAAAMAASRPMCGESRWAVSAPAAAAAARG